MCDVQCVLTSTWKQSPPTTTNSRCSLAPLPFACSKERPHSRVFCLYLFSSLLGQFVVYISFLMYMQRKAHGLMLTVRVGGRLLQWQVQHIHLIITVLSRCLGPFLASPQEDRQLPNADFKPNLINTICFLVNFIIQVGVGGSRGHATVGPMLLRRPLCPRLLRLLTHLCRCSAPASPRRDPYLQTMTFAVNYVGEPFNTPLLQNKFFALSVRFSVVMYFALVLDFPRGACLHACIECRQCPAGDLRRSWAGRWLRLEWACCMLLLLHPPHPPHLPLAPVPRAAGLSSWFSLVPIPAGMQVRRRFAEALRGDLHDTAVDPGCRPFFPDIILPCP